MSPTANCLGSFGARIATLLAQSLPHGGVVVEWAVETRDGSKEADVACLSPELWARVAEDFSRKIAPEICVEVLSPSNTVLEMMGKKDLYLAAGAHEYWLCEKEGRMRFFDASGGLTASALVPQFPALVKRPI